MGVKFEMRRWAKSYLAQILGPDPKYQLEREFIRAGGETKSLLRWDLEPGFYETRQGWNPDNREWWIVDGLKARNLTDTEYANLATLAAAGAPGAPGAYESDRCHCGLEVEAFTAEGLPRCNRHHVDTTIDENEPVPV